MKQIKHMEVSEEYPGVGELTIHAETRYRILFRWIRFKSGLKVIWIGLKFMFKKYDKKWQTQH